MVGLLTCVLILVFPEIHPVTWSFVLSFIAYSCGNSSGFSPDSLLIDVHVEPNFIVKLDYKNDIEYKYLDHIILELFMI